MSENAAAEGVTPEAQAAVPDAGAAAPEQATPAKWFDGIGDADLRQYVEAKGFDKVEVGEVINSYRNLEKLRGVPADRLLKLPEKMDEPGAMDEVFNRLGRPEAPEKYTNVLGENMADGVYKGIAAEAHKAGVTDAQWQVMQKALAAQTAALGEQAAAAQNEALDQWKAENPQAFTAVQQLSQRAGISADEMQAALDGDNAAFYRVLGKVAGLGFEKPVPQGQDGASFSMSPATAKQKIAEKLADKDFTDRYYNVNPRVRQPAIEEMERLQKLASGVAA